MPSTTITSKTVELDAAGQSVGRLATQIARILIGKHKATYAPNVDSAYTVRVKNASKLVLTGNKTESKLYYHYSQYPGGMKTRAAKDLMVKDPGKVLRYAVDRMLPKNTLRARRIKRLTITK
jgi:large subunit ribosomal protein L13